MSRNRQSLLSDASKLALAQLQGAGDRVSPGDYGNLTSREAGNFTKYAVMVAEKALAGGAPDPSAQG
jgi:small acid-soluble spore protein F (minor alpha/beta-type SASP)